jgi:hypothetical protein
MPYRLGKQKSGLVLLTPVVLLLFFFSMLVIPGTRATGLWLLKENHPVEVLTFGVFMAAGIYGLSSTKKSLNQKMPKFVVAFYFLFSLCLLLIAMEEIAWGQWFFKFSTPDYWKEINRQGETTLHNVGIMQDHTDSLHLVFGIAGLIGITLKKNRYFKFISAPLLLFPWFVVIVLQASVDVYVDSYSLGKGIDKGIQRLSELIELLIACSSFLYLWLNSIALRQTQVSNSD